MEKISNIVPVNARTGTVDVKASTGVRPGALAFGRPLGDSHGAAEKAETTTATRAAALQSELNDLKKGHAQDRAVEQMADQFFMTKMRRPDSEAAVGVESKEPNAEGLGELKAEMSNEMVSSMKETEGTQPPGYTPRGSYVDVRV